MKFLYLFLNWGFGLFFLLLGIFGTLAESLLLGIPFICISFILLPPVRKWVYSKTKKEMSVVVRTILIFVFLGVFGVFSQQNMEKKSAQILEIQQAKQKSDQHRLERKQKKVVYFNTNREQIISDIKISLTAKEYQSVLSQSNKYLVLNDKELNELNSIAKTKIAEIRKAQLSEQKRLADIEKVKKAEIRKAELAEQKRLADIEKADKTQKILAELKKIPVEQYEKNRDLYQQLSKINPTNEKYREKYNFYSITFNEANRKWYEGGTLHKKNGFDWRKASQKNKLATCADFIANLWKKELFKEDIQKNFNSVDDVKFLANKLVIELDAFFKKADDDTANNFLGKQKVSKTATQIIFLAGWLK